MRLLLLAALATPGIFGQTTPKKQNAVPPAKYEITSVTDSLVLPLIDRGWLSIYQIQLDPRPMNSFPLLTFKAIATNAGTWHYGVVNLQLGMFCVTEGDALMRKAPRIVNVDVGISVETKYYKKVIEIPLNPKLCETWVVRASFPGKSPVTELTENDLMDMQAKHQKYEKQRKAEQEAASERIAAGKRKLEAAEAARQKAEAIKVRAACLLIYEATSEKKLKDVTVKEDQQIKACQFLGLYPPR